MVKNNYLFLYPELIKHVKNANYFNNQVIEQYKNIKNFYIFIYPDKCIVYNNHLPDNYKIEIEDRSYLKNYKEILDNKVIDLYECLKNENDIYYKTDTHINLKGSYLVYNYFVDSIKNNYNIDLPHINLNILQKKTVNSLSSLNIGIGDLTWENNLGQQILNDITDTYYDDYDNSTDLVFYMRTNIDKNLSIKLLTKNNLIDETILHYGKIFSWDILSKYILYRKNNNCKNNLKILIFYDSFLAHSLYLYLNLFSEIYFIKDIFDINIINKINPDLIFEFRIERFLN